MRPSFSVVIPTYNDDDRLSLTLWGLTQQSFKDFEVIVVNDGGEDETRRLIDVYSTKLNVVYRYLYPKSSDYRPSQARNLGIANASASRILFIDCDTIPHRHLLAHHKKAYSSSYTSVGIRYHIMEEDVKEVLAALVNNTLSYELLNSLKLRGDDRIIRSEYRDRFYTLSASCFDTSDYASKVVHASFGHSCNICYPTNVIRSLNGFDIRYDNIWGGEDHDLAIRFLASGGKFVTLPSALVYHLDHRRRSTDDKDKLRELLEQTRFKSKIEVLSDV